MKFVIIWFASVSVVSTTPAVALKEFRVSENKHFEYSCGTSPGAPLDFDIESGGTVQWYCNGSLIDIGPHFSYQRDVINISGVRRSDQGNWAVKKRFFISSAQQVHESWCNFTLRIDDDFTVASNFSTDQFGKGAPEFSSLDTMHKMELVVKKRGESVTFKCIARGHPKLRVSWTKNGQTMKRSDVFKMKGWSLTLDPLNVQDSGKYTCTVINNYGKINFTFELLVTDKSKALSRKNVELVSGETARLNCNVVRQDRSSRIEWLRRAEVNGSSVDSAGAPLFEVLEVDDSDGRDARILSIENVTSEDTGLYVCTITDQDGTSYAKSAWFIQVHPITTQDHHPNFTYMMAGILCAVACCVILVIVVVISKYMKTKSYL